MAAKTDPIGLLTMSRSWAVTRLHNVFKINLSDIMCKYIARQTYCSLVLNMSVIATIYCEKLLPLYNHIHIYVEQARSRNHPLSICGCVYLMTEIQRQWLMMCVNISTTWVSQPIAQPILEESR